MSRARVCPECEQTFTVPYASDLRTYCSRSCSAKQWARRRTLDVNANWRGGKTKHPLYDTYNEMLARCSRPTHTRWSSYGGRGITVCQRWQEDFWNFVSDMGERPAGKSLDRTNNDLGYSPENCRWATDSEQAINRRPMPRPAECKAGHKHTEENTRITPGGKQRCRTCERKWAADRRARLAAA